MIIASNAFVGENGLRVAYEMLNILTNNVKLAEKIVEIKKYIRDALKQKSISNRKVIYGDCDKCIELIEFPLHIKTKEEAIEYFDNNYKMYYIPSPYSFTCNRHTADVKIFKRNNRFCAYHTVSADI